MIAETEFRRRLASLIARYDQRPCVVDDEQETDDEWASEWQTMLRDATPDQCRRAEELLVLHVQNSVEELAS